MESSINLEGLLYSYWHHASVPIKKDFAGGPQNQKMTMPDNMSSQSVSMDKVQNRGRLDEKWSTGPEHRFLFLAQEAPLSTWEQPEYTLISWPAEKVKI